MTDAALTRSVSSLSMFLNPQRIEAPPGAQREVIVVTDPGDDIDDHWAVSMLLSMPSIRVRLVLCDSHSAVDRANVLAEFLTQANHSHVPIGIGPNRSGAGLVMCGYARPGALRSYAGPVFQDGVGALLQMTMAPPPPPPPPVP